MINNELFVLVADDDLRVIKRYKRSLMDSYNISVTSAATLEELDEKFDKFFNNIDLIILDGCIPGSELNTIEFIENARKRGFAKPIIAASSAEYYRDLMVEAGCDHKSKKDHAPHRAFEILLGL